MNTSRNDTIWLVRGQARRSAQRVGAGVLARAVAVAALLAGASVGLATQQAPAIGEKRPALTATVDATRLVAPAEPRAPMPAARVAMQVKTSGAPESWRMLDPRPAVGRPHFTAGDPGQTGSLTPGGFRAAIGHVSGDWREEEFPRVEALDGRTLAGPALRIRLSGLELPQGDEICRTLDGRLEACAARAATPLELMTRHRKVTCRYRVEAAGEAAGTCRVGASDIGERLLRTGLLKRSGEPARVAMAASSPSAN
ncbi:MAG TPA: hypothetical protein VKA80_09880 [Beijerinckiaceae bacterium]|nr:hypothetical protein [Beijerinckiaceae bacterium]